MEKSKQKYSTKITVQEIDNGVILHLISVGKIWNYSIILLSLITAPFIVNAISSLAKSYENEAILIMGIGIFVLSIILLLGIGTRERRIILDNKSLRFERDNAFGTHIPIYVERKDIKDISVFYFPGKYAGRVRIILKQGGYTHLIENSGEKCQKIADVLNHNLHWMKQ